MITRYGLGQVHLGDGVYGTQIVAREDGAFVEISDYEMCKEACLDNLVRATRLEGELEELRRKVTELLEADREFNAMLLRSSAECSTQACNAAESRRYHAMEALA